MPYWTPEELDGLCAFSSPDAASLVQEVDAYQWSWLDQMAQRIPGTIAIQTALMPFVVPRAMGMALYKTGEFTGEHDRPWNGRLALIGLGTLISGFGVWQNEVAGWSREYSFFLGSVLRSLGKGLLVLGYIGGMLCRCEGQLGHLLEGAALAPLTAANKARAVPTFLTWTACAV